MPRKAATTEMNNNEEYDGLTDIGTEQDAEVSESTAKNNATSTKAKPTVVEKTELASSSWEEAESDFRDGIRKIERAYNFFGIQNKNLPAEKRINMIAVDTRHQPRALLRDGKVQFDSNGNAIMEEPGVNLQIKARFGDYSLSLPLYQSIEFPKPE